MECEKKCGDLECNDSISVTETETNEPESVDGDLKVSLRCDQKCEGSLRARAALYPGRTDVASQSSMIWQFAEVALENG